MGIVLLLNCSIVELLDSWKYEYIMVATVHQAQQSNNRTMEQSVSLLLNQIPKLIQD
jgi:uncharacterized protein YlxP (DUF503 family)